MSAINTDTTLPDIDWESEEQCIEYLRLFREKNGLKCPKCGGTRFTWCEAETRWTCKDCKHVISLTGETIMHSSNLPLHYWFTAIRELSKNPKVSSKYIQRLLGHKRYQPIWEMVNKIKARNIKDIIDIDHLLTWDDLEIDELDDVLIKEADFTEILEGGMDGRSEFKHKLYNNNNGNNPQVD